MTLTDRDEAIMAVLQGVPVNVVADELQVSESTIYRWMREGGHSSQVKKMERRKITNLYIERPEMNVHDICDKFGISTATLYRMLHERNIPLRKPTRAKNPDMDDLVVDMYESGNTLLEIRQATGKGYGTIYEILEDRNVRLRLYSTRRGE